MIFSIFVFMILDFTLAFLNHLFFMRMQKINSKFRSLPHSCLSVDKGTVLPSLTVFKYDIKNTKL